MNRMILIAELGSCWFIIFVTMVIKFEDVRALKIVVMDVNDGSASGQLVEYNISSQDNRQFALLHWRHLDTQVSNVFQAPPDLGDSYDIWLFTPELCERHFFLNTFTSRLQSINCFIPSPPSSSAMDGPTSCYLPGTGSSYHDKMCIYKHDSKKRVDAILAVLRHLDWTNVIILYDSDTENDWPEVRDGLVGITLVLYNVEEAESLTVMFEELYNNTVYTTRNFLVMCSNACINTLLKQAMEFDKSNRGRTALSVFSKWLVVNLEGKTELQDGCNVDLDNVAVINFPFIDERTSKKILINDLQTIIIDVTIEDQEDSPNMTTNVQHALKRELTTYSDCWAAGIYTLLWKPEGRQLSPVGHVNYTGHVSLPSDVVIFPNTKFGLNGRVFRANTNEWHPHTIRHPSVNGSVRYDGIAFDIVEALRSVMNFSYTLQEPVDGEWGRPVNGTWTGVVQQLNLREVDLHIGPLAITVGREAALDYIYPYTREYSAVVFRLPDPNKDKWRKLIEPFTWQVHICVASSFCFSILLLYFMENLNPFYDRKEIRRQTFQGIMLYLYGALLSHGGPETPKSSSGRSLVAAWWIFAIMTGATFSGTLIASLTVSKVKLPFETIKSLGLQDTYTWGTLKGSSWESLLAFSNRSEYKLLWDGIVKFNQTDKEILVLDLSIHKDKVKTENFALITDEATAIAISAESCDITVMKELFYPSYYAFALQNNSPYLDIFTEEMMKLVESGVVQIIQTKWWPDKGTCAQAATTTKAIELADLQSAFYVIVIGVVVASLLVIIESCFMKDGDKISLRYCKKTRDGHI